ncbi:MAG: tetratricopeptide repeat protein [Planctomycetota bacterium]|nr:tetratricopeptide repeat protein [Planctomycetota bacterium]
MELMVADDYAANLKPKRRWIAPLIISLCIVAVYANSFRGPFVYDDLDSIRNNPQIRTVIPTLEPGRTPSTISGRPVLRLTFALNYTLSGLHVPLYHATNLFIHIAAALLVFGIVRRNLSSREFWGDHFIGVEAPLAATVAVIWAVHPLNTESVTYIVQRAESLAGVFYLLTVYGLIRSVEGSQRSRLWAVVAVIACAVGMATKEILATAPLVALIYDRTFLAGSFTAALQKRRSFYLSLAATWIILIVLLADGARSKSVGFHLGLSPLDYARTQLPAIAHYLRLALYPSGLVLDEARLPVLHWRDIGWGWVICGLAAVVIAALWRKPWVGFLGAWFFLILAPSSSFVPIVTETAAEHRMYLPLIAVVALLVVAGWDVLSRYHLSRFSIPLAALAAITLGWATIDRNNDYRTAVGLWRDTVAKRPFSARAHYNLGFALAEDGHQFPPRSPQAVAIAHQAADEFRQTLHLMPDYYPAASRLGEALVELGDLSVAENYYTHLLTVGPHFQGEAHFQRGTLRARRLDWAGAKDDFQAAVAARPDDAQSHYLLGVVLQQLNDWQGAERELQKALELAPGNEDARARLAQVLLRDH